MLPDGFDPQPFLQNATLDLRPLRPEDLEGLQLAAASPETWAGHPAKDRHKPEVFASYFQFLLGSGTTLVAIDRASARIIGCSRYYGAPDRPGSISVGFTFLDPRFWGGRTNRSLKQLMLGHAFAAVADVWFHIAPSNIRSQRATAKLGAEHDHDAVLNLSGSPAAWMCFRLDREAWQRMLATQDA